VAERSIIQRDWQVRALLDGRRTQVRVPVRGVFGGGDGNGTGRWSYIASSTEAKRRGCFAFSEVLSAENEGLLPALTAKHTERGREIEFACVRPPFAVGDLLWVREAHAIFSAFGQERSDGRRWGPWSGLPTTLSPDRRQIAYFREGFDRCAPRWRSSTQMPRWAARIWLRVVSVRIERVQDITEEDARAEGVDPLPLAGAGMQPPRKSHRHAFLLAWRDAHGDESIDRNDWVWAYTVERCAAPEDRR